MMKNKIKIALCQMDIDPDFNKNVSNAIDMINKAAQKGAKIVMLPEIFISPYDVRRFKKIVINDKDHLIKTFSELSLKKKMMIVAGSVVERSGRNLYNTSFIFEKGRLIGKYRKTHLFDVDIKGKITFQESSVFKPGNIAKTFNTSFGKIGVVICFDLRFPEMVRSLAKQGAKMIFAPAAFSHITGPLHWELIVRARAMDSQSFVFACSPALNKKYSYQAWGHSAIVDPYGVVVNMLGFKSGILCEEINLNLVEKVRKEIPIL